MGYAEAAFATQQLQQLFGYSQIWFKKYNQVSLEYNQLFGTIRCPYDQVSVEYEEMAMMMKGGWGLEYAEAAFATQQLQQLFGIIRCPQSTISRVNFGS